jgi:peptide chain release factor subunit 1
MQQFNFLTKLMEFEPAGFPFVSVYLNTEPNETGKRDFEIFLKKQLKDHGAVMEPGSSELESYDADVDKINNFVENLDPTTRGVAIFACSGSDGLFERFEFEVPFEENQFTVAEKPDMLPIVRLVSKYPPFAVVAADTNEAHIYVFKRGKTVGQEVIQNIKTNRSEVGGWSQMRYQRHIDNFHQQHAKEVIEEVAKLIREDNIDRVILSGDESVIIPILRAEIPKEFEDKIAGTISLNVKSPVHEVYEAAAKAIDEHDIELEKQEIERLLENNYDDGIGVVGAEETLKALLNGQVQELFISANPDDISYSRNDVRAVLKAYEPGEDGDLPDASEKIEIINEFVKRAAMSADSIRFVSDPQLLKTHGGIGAILRYQAKGVSNI